MPTTLISLVREHTEAMKPARALWVPFMLGRPLGVPNDPAFQRRVVLSALKLFERPGGPVLEDFPEDAPDTVFEGESENMACPVSFSRDPATMTPTERLLDEIAQLQIWHDISVKTKGRSALGVTGKSSRELGTFIAAWAEQRSTSAFREGLRPGDALRQACDELKVFYLESAAAQPGKHSSQSIQAWFWSKTVAAELYFKLHQVLKESPDPVLNYFANQNLLPRAAWALSGRGEPPKHNG